MGHGCFHDIVGDNYFLIILKNNLLLLCVASILPLSYTLSLQNNCDNKKSKHLGTMIRGGW